MKRSALVSMPGVIHDGSEVVCVAPLGRYRPKSDLMRGHIPDTRFFANIFKCKVEFVADVHEVGNISFNYIPKEDVDTMNGTTLKYSNKDFDFKYLDAKTEQPSNCIDVGDYLVRMTAKSTSKGWNIHKWFNNEKTTIVILQ